MLLVWAEGLSLVEWCWKSPSNGNWFAKNDLEPMSGNGLCKFQTRRYRNACDQLVTIPRKDPGNTRGLVQYDFNMVGPEGLEPPTNRL